MKKKVTFSLLVYPDEERILKESLKHGITSISWIIINRAYKRGDFVKNE